MKIILLVLISAGFIFCAKKPDCESVKLGTFENMTRETWITKTKDRQIEKDKVGDTWYNEWALTYINDCEYYMILEIDKSKGSTIFTIGDIIKITINEILSDKYLWTAEYKGRKFDGHNFITK
jgi:hypothetical protein